MHVANVRAFGAAGAGRDHRGVGAAHGDRGERRSGLPDAARVAACARLDDRARGPRPLRHCQPPRRHQLGRVHPVCTCTVHYYSIARSLLGKSDSNQLLLISERKHFRVQTPQNVLSSSTIHLDI